MQNQSIRGRSLPNEMLKEMSKFIPYLLEDNQKRQKKSMAIISSYNLSSYITPSWQKIKAKRRGKTQQIIKELKSIWDLRYATDIHRKLRKLHLIRELKHYWETPAERICTFCCAAFRNDWEFESIHFCIRRHSTNCCSQYKFKEAKFELCPKKLHSVHKSCLRQRSFACRLCSPPTFKELYGYLHEMYPREYEFTHLNPRGFQINCF